MAVTPDMRAFVVSSHPTIWYSKRTYKTATGAQKWMYRQEKLHGHKRLQYSVAYLGKTVGYAVKAVATDR